MSCEGNAQELSDGVAARRTTWKVSLKFNGQWTLL